MGTKQGGQSVLNDLFYMIGGHIIKPAHLFRVFPYPQPLRSVSGSSLSFLHPPLSSVTRITIQLPPRISVTLEKSFYILLSLDPVCIYP